MAKNGALGAEGMSEGFAEALAAAATETATVRVERDTYKAAVAESKAGEKKATDALAALSHKFAAYVGAEAKLAGKGTVETVDKMLASMVDDSGVPRAAAIAEHFAGIARGAALPKETQEPADGPSARGPSADKRAAEVAALDGSKMTLTAIAGFASDAPTFERLMAQHSATQTRTAATALFPTLGASARA